MRVIIVKTTSLTKRAVTWRTGHSSVKLDRAQMTHGIVGNNWYDRKKSKSIYCTDDSNYDHIGGDDYSGNKSPNNLLVETF